jgi:hypothetical protein
MKTTTPEEHEQKAAYVAASIYDLAKPEQLDWQVLTAIINIALMLLDNGHSAATAYETGASYVRAILTNPNPNTNIQAI